MNGLLVFSALLAATLGGRLPIDEEYPYIVGGKDTNITEVPYQVSLHVYSRFKCGGSILSRTHILTAAHCVTQEYYYYEIRAGSNHEKNGGVLVPVEEVFSHPNFSMATLDYDVAVLQLETPLNFSKTIQPIKLVDKQPPDGDPVLASGWGHLKEGGPKPDSLQSVLIPMVNRKTCENNYKKYLEITPRMICAGVEGKDSCQGDSGGPLAHKGALAGIVSWGVGCARKDFPGIYTNIADPDIRKFIKEHAKV